MSDFYNTPGSDDHNNDYYVAPRVNMKKPIVTYFLIAVNVLVYVAMTILQYAFHLDQNLLLFVFGAKVNALIDAGQVWRLISCMFLHSGIAHLLCNCYAIYIYGPIVERLYGRWRFILIYFISGLSGSILSYAFSPIASVGASGAIFGLIGCMFYFRERHPEIFKRIFGRTLFIVLGINLILGFIQTGIDIYGHIGGFLGGFISSWGIGLLGEKVKISKRAAVFIILLMILTGCVALGRFLSNY